MEVIDHLHVFLLQFVELPTFLSQFPLQNLYLLLQFVVFSLRRHVRNLQIEQLQTGPVLHGFGLRAGAARLAGLETIAELGCFEQSRLKTAHVVQSPLQRILKRFDKKVARVKRLVIELLERHPFFFYPSE